MIFEKSLPMQMPSFEQDSVAFSNRTADNLEVLEKFIASGFKLPGQYAGSGMNTAGNIIQKKGLEPPVHGLLWTKPIDNMAYNMLFYGSQIMSPSQPVFTFPRHSNLETFVDQSDLSTSKPLPSLPVQVRQNIPRFLNEQSSPQPKRRRLSDATLTQSREQTEYLKLLNSECDDLEDLYAHRFNRTSSAPAAPNCSNQFDIKLVKAEKPKKKPASQYRGVSYHKRDNKWMARAWIDGEMRHEGCFFNEHLAGLVVDLRKILVYGETKARLLNFNSFESRVLAARKFVEICSDCPANVREYAKQVLEQDEEQKDENKKNAELQVGQGGEQEEEKKSKQVTTASGEKPDSVADRSI
eukprot:CAMPEP_0203756180 /NCGR_PEP_ID=MMETSP0098-20131031/9492_1 /ASSEMBLY_ACC=CAM_ASM_000208 /TAXON_ID=96639 /ORGANISM=" , Strain NY0313808BC1" /LENGTH=353 /DNA_ID=CAMNT_0050647945 /DNA_START=673 /DNA_END=1734 /DNA_ORIENTATION=+